MRPDPRAWLRDKRPRGYLRVSSATQADKYGPAAQRHDEEQAAGALGMRELGHFYEDHITGRDALKRSDFQRMVADARARQFDVLIVGRVDRFARNERDAWNYLHTLAEAGVAVYFVEEDVLIPHDDSWQDRLGAEINSAAAYSRKLSRNVRKGLDRKRAQGGYVGGVPWGFRLAADRLHLESSDDLPVRLLIWELYATGGYTFATLAAELNGRGHRIRDRLFTNYTLKEILARTRPIELELGLLQREIFDAARAILSRRRGSAQKAAQRRNHYVFAGIARCSDCGETWWGRMKTRPDRRTRLQKQIMHAPRGCRRGQRSENELTERFAHWLASWRLPNDFRATLARFLAARHDDHARAVRRGQLEAELERVRKLYQWGDITEEAYAAERRRVVRALDELGPEVTPALPSQEALRLAARIGEAWLRASEETRRRFLEEWFEEMRISRDGAIELVAREPYRWIVAASVGQAGVGMVGDAGLEPATSTL